MATTDQRSIVENVVQYLKDESSLDDTVFIDTVENPNTPIEIIKVTETGGTSANWPLGTQEAGISIQTRAEDDYTAREYAFIAWNILREIEHNFTLPASGTITGSATQDVLHVDVETRPFALGNRSGYYGYVFSVIITYNVV